MSGPNPHNIPEQHRHRREDSRVTTVSSTPSADTVSGIPLVQVYAPPLGHEYGVQQQFPPPLPTAQYIQYGGAGYEYKPEYATHAAMPHPPPPPSLYYSRYPTPNHAGVSLPQGAMPPPLVTSAGHVRTRQVPANYNDGRVYTVTFDDAVVRDDFVKRVLCLMLLQFTASSVLSALCLENSGFREVVKGIPWVVWISLVSGLMVIVFTKIKPETCRKKYPERYLFLAWTAALVISLTWITTLLNVEFLLVLQVLLAVIIASLLIVNASFIRFIDDNRFLLSSQALYRRLPC